MGGLSDLRKGFLLSQELEAVGDSKLSCMYYSNDLGLRNSESFWHRRPSSGIHALTSFPLVKQTFAIFRSAKLDF